MCNDFEYQAEQWQQQNILISTIFFLSASRFVFSWTGFLKQWPIIKSTSVPCKIFIKDPEGINQSCLSLYLCRKLLKSTWCTSCFIAWSCILITVLKKMFCPFCQSQRKNRFHLFFNNLFDIGNTDSFCTLVHDNILWFTLYLQKCVHADDYLINNNCDLHKCRTFGISVLWCHIRHHVKEVNVDQYSCSSI